MPEIQLSHYGRASSLPSPVNLMMTEFAGSFRPGTDINLGAGYVNERTIPREIITQAMERVIANPSKYKHPFNYGGSQGTSNLITSIKSFYQKYSIGSISDQNFEKHDVLIGSNGATSILEAISEIHEPGIVITADPVYYIYGEFLQRKGYTLLSIPEDNDGLRTDLLKEEIEKSGNKLKNISFFYIVTVNNPTTAILSNKRRKEIVDLAFSIGEKTGKVIPVYFDKAYEEIIHGNIIEKPLSGLNWNENGNVFEIGTLSKILAPAFRIGYLIGKRNEIFNAILQRNSDVGFSASVINQEMTSYILDHHIAAQLSKVNKEYAEKARQIEKALKDEIGNEIEEYTGGKASFYFYVTLKKTLTTPLSRFFNFLSRTTGDPSIDGEGNKNPGTIYLPGVYCVNPTGKLAEKAQRQFRLSFGFEETEKVIEGIKFMGDAVKYSGQDF